MDTVSMWSRSTDTCSFQASRDATRSGSPRRPSSSLRNQCPDDAPGVALGLFRSRLDVFLHETFALKAGAARICVSVARPAERPRCRAQFRALPARLAGEGAWRTAVCAAREARVRGAPGPCA